MTKKEWKEQNKDAAFTSIWAADTPGGFGKKGWSAYGNTDDCEVIGVETRPDGFQILSVWFTKLWGVCPG